MTAKEILELIEKVDPENSADLNQIDGRVSAYVNRYEFACVSEPADYISWDTAKAYKDNGRGRDTIYWDIMPNKSYTRSRDFLKAIRPEGWFFGMWEGIDTFRCILSSRRKPGDVLVELDAKGLPTEELAELHAIIQAIAFERGEG